MEENAIGYNVLKHTETIIQELHSIVRKMDVLTPHQYIQTQQEAVQVWCAICSVNRDPVFKPTFYLKTINWLWNITHHVSSQHEEE